MTKQKPSSSPLLITGRSISEAYSKTLTYITNNPGNEISPLVLSIDNFSKNGSVPEDANVRSAMDEVLKHQGKISVEDIAFTIFPQQLWTMAKGDRNKLFEFYGWSYPAFKAWNKSANGRGLYFQRLTMYGRGPCDGNQLEWILQQMERKGARRSLAQATTFDPEHDHDSTAQLGFPCLQHVTFVAACDGLVINAFYATQQLFDKAYGNYLGLAQLGAFMAHEMKMPLARLNINIGVAKLERIGKTDPTLFPLLKAAENCIESNLVDIGNVTP